MNSRETGCRGPESTGGMLGSIHGNGTFVPLLRELSSASFDAVNKF